MARSDLTRCSVRNTIELPGYEEIGMKRILPALLLAGALLPSSMALDQPNVPAPTVKVGDMAPDFTLTDQNGNKVSLHDFKGKKNVALAFYIFAFTGG